MLICIENQSNVDVQSHLEMESIFECDLMKKNVSSKVTYFIRDHFEQKSDFPQANMANSKKTKLSKNIY